MVPAEPSFDGYTGCTVDTGDWSNVLLDTGFVGPDGPFSVGNAGHRRHSGGCERQARMRRVGCSRAGSEAREA